MDKIHAFVQLKQYANPSQQDRFVMRFDLSQTQVLFEIDGKVIEKCNLYRLLNVSENCIFKVMEEDEEELFFKICIKYGEKFLSIQNYYKTWLLNLDRKLMRMMKLRMKFISLCDLEKIEKWHVLNGMVRLLRVRWKNYAAFKWGLLVLPPNF